MFTAWRGVRVPFSRRDIALPAACLTIVLGSLSASISAGDGAQPEKKVISQLAWMTGGWSGKQGASNVEEHWIEPRGGIMLGVNRTVRDSGKTSFEFMRIAETGNDVVYYASPSGAPATPFKLTKVTDSEAVFENPEHDFPQKISYRRDGNKMNASISGTINGKERSMQWEWTVSTPPSAK